MLRTAAASLRTFARPAPPCSCSCIPSSSRLFSAVPLPAPASKYTLPKGLELKGTVVNTGKMAQTCTVSVERRMTDHTTLKAHASLTPVLHPQEFSKHTKYLVHDPNLTCVVGDQVKIRNCRPVSARKRFELVEVTKGARERQSHHGAGAVQHDAQAQAQTQPRAEAQA
ncbi:hypothetical protein JCM10450v2_002715 [Rhodotorula kratochvilovae]